MKKLAIVFGRFSVYDYLFKPELPSSIVINILYRVYVYLSRSPYRRSYFLPSGVGDGEI